jgi:hypothetical protein
MTALLWVTWDAHQPMADVLWALQVDGAKGSDFLRVLERKWIDHKREMIMIRDIFLYLVCICFARECDYWCTVETMSYYTNVRDRTIMDASGTNLGK